MAIGIPFFVVITKIDIAPENVYDKNIAIIQKILSSPHARKRPIVVKGEENEDISEIADEMENNVVCPIFSVSNVTG